MLIQKIRLCLSLEHQTHLKVFLRKTKKHGKLICTITIMQRVTPPTRIWFIFSEMLDLESWKLHMARHFHCEACESIRPGGSSSGNVPPAATHESFKPCQAIQLDAREWLVPGQRTKIKFILFIDLATTFRAVHVVREYDLSEMKAATTADVTEGFSQKWLSQKWLCDKPKPALLIPDNSKTFQSKEMHEFCNLVGIQLCFPPEKEGWAHGVVESALKDIKITASAIQTDSPGLSPRVTLLLACASLNSTEYTKGYSHF